ncbi:probable adenylate kinase 7, mitochondrial isoform X1 [Cucumis sativus]|uniref:probable adenylate kinase 7, mitochondrial isoform X1 n=1 Tax=Cucumis sativus TaxID=3659 RepID=UPI0005ED3C9C|nr:probable adenylate kinase 7, mitochondrial isoform X1 [Cucumis sativus]
MSLLARLSAVARPLCNPLHSQIATRAYGSAAALEVDYDYYEDDDDFDRLIGDRTHGRAMADSRGWVPKRGVQWVVLGDPRAKKHVYAERLSKLLHVPHISMGGLVRQELHPRSSIYQQIASSINEGKPVLEEIIFRLLSKRLEEGYCNGESGFILEGIPRTRNQAEILDQIADIDLVINFKTTEEPLIRKNLGSGNFSGFHEYSTICGSGSSQHLQPKGKESECLSATTEYSWKEMTSIEQVQRKPLVEYYRGQRKLVDFQVREAPGETWEGLLKALHLQHINALSSSSSTQKLTT